MIDLSLYRILRYAREFEFVRFSDLKSVVNNPRTLSRKIKFLLNHGLLTRDRIGYRITDRGLKVLKLMQEILELIGARNEFRIINIERIPHKYYAQLVERYSRLLLEHFSSRLLSIVLFGSVSRGDWDRDSDIDLLIIVDDWDNMPIWKRLRELYEIREKLRKTGEYRSALEAGYTPVIQHYPLGRREALKFHRIYLDIVLDGIVIYDRDCFISRIIDTLRDRLMKYGAKRITKPDGKYYWVVKEIKAGEVYTL